MQPQHKSAIPMAVSMLLVVIALFTSGWATLSERGGKVGAGVSSVSMCFEGHCETRKYAELVEHGDKEDGLAILWSGRVMLIFGLLLLASALWSTINVAVRKGPQLALTSTMAGVGMFVSLIFVFVVIGVTSKGSEMHMTPGYSLILFFLGAIGLIVTTALAKGAVRRLNATAIPGMGAPPPGYGAPMQQQQYGAPPPYGAPPQQQQYGAPPQQYGAPPMQQPPQQFAPQAPFCPRDGAPTRWLPDQQRFVCDRCQQLV